MCSSEIESNPRQNPMATSSFRSPSVVIFDIDDTILDVTQRYKDAVRAGYIDKERGAKRKKTFETPGKARKRAMEFLFSPDNLRKDRVVPGSIALINTLMEQGHTIVYVTARNAKYRDVTRTQLEDKGFPIFKDDTDMELLFFKPSIAETAEKYKQGVYAKLLSKYDVRMVFDDKAENLQMAAGLGITGLYPTIRDYTKYQVKSNPHAFYSSIVDDKGYPKEDPDEEPYQSYRSHSDESGMGRTGYSATNPPLNCGCGKTPCMTFGGLSNPGGIQSKVESILVKEGGAAGLKPLKAAFPKGTTKAQATAAIAKMSSVYQHPAGDYILKNPGHSGNYMVPRDIHRLGKAADRLEETYEDGLDTPEWWKSKLSVTAKDADTIADSLDYVANNPADILPIMSGEPTGQHNKLGAVFSEVFIGRNVVKDVGEAVQGIYRGLVGGRTSMAERRMAMAIASMQKELSDRAKALGGNAVANLKVDYEMVQGTATLTVIGTADAVKMRSPPRKNPIPLNISVQVKGYRNTAGAFVMKGKKFLILQRSKKETSKHGLWELPGGKVEKGETPRETAVIETQEEAGLDVTLKVNLGSHIDDKKKKVYHAFIATPKKGQKVKLSEEHVSHKWVTPEEVMAMPKKMVSHHLMHFLKKEGETIRSNPFIVEGQGMDPALYHQFQNAIDYSNDMDARSGDENFTEVNDIEFRDLTAVQERDLYPRSNPPKNKIEKGKKLYEHMNGKAPEKIEKKKIDMGDVWYQVGEGGCWQIGYMSGKETGKTEQKYTHTFNEETKDGNFPKLYATMPENGKPLLIIQGGTWKIRTDDKGVAWIYD